jgi:Cu-processing system ATP-binding protein
VLRTPFRNLSGGTRQRVNAALAFLLQPELLILDEPTAALDPVSSSILKDKIRTERSKGRTFILTSHVLSELEELADRIVFLLDGTVWFAGRPQELLRATGETKLERAVAAIMQARSSARAEAA